MEQVNFLQTSLADFSKEKTLRFDVKFHNVFTRVVKTGETTSLLNFFEIGTKEYEGREVNEIKYVEIGSVTNEGDIIPFNLADDVGLDVIEKERLIEKIENGDIFKPQKGSLLIASVRPNLKKFVSIGSKESSFHFTKAFIYLVPKQNLIEGRLLKYLLRTVLFDRLVGLCREGKGYPTLKENDLKFFFIDNDLIKKLEFNKEKILKKINENEQKILQIKSKIESLQDIIDDVFVKYQMKETKKSLKDKFIVENLTILFSKLSNNFYLRNSSLYNIFWEKYSGKLFENSTYPIVKLKSLIKPNIKRVKKGILDKPMILLNFEDIESYTGRILNKNYIEEIDSEKNIISGNDIVISKMNNHLGYVFLPFQSEDTIIGSSEFIPYLVLDKKFVLPEFIKFCLLSYDFLKISTFLRSGKSQSHPRIHISDLLNIKIPLPDLEIQQKIVSEIQLREEESNHYKEQIKKLRKEIDDLIHQLLK